MLNIAPLQHMSLYVRLKFEVNNDVIFSRDRAMRVMCFYFLNVISESKHMKHIVLSKSLNVMGTIRAFKANNGHIFTFDNKQSY